MVNDESMLEMVSRVADCYLNSRDFNGLPVRELIDPSAQNSHTIVAEWLKTGNFEICLAEHHVNPYINRLGFGEMEIVLSALPDSDLNHAVLYPSADVLEKQVDRQRYADRPFELLLALGDPQLSLAFFGLEVLEWYRNDPRYHYHFDDIRGWISIGDEAAESSDTLERDKTHLQTFGMAYDTNRRPVICTFLRYLANLDPLHQKLWQARELTGEYKVHPDYIRNSIEGDWGEFVSHHQAILMELQVINNQCKAIGWLPLFRRDYANERPRGFGILLRPTSDLYSQFCHLLDKLLSENINRDFFRDKVPLEEEIERKDGKIEVRPRGTISMLKDWLKSSFRATDPKPLDDAIDSLRAVRKERQGPAHRIINDRFDYSFIDKQRAIVDRAYRAVRLLRLLLSNHPAASSIEIPDEIKTGEKIWPL